MSDVPTAAGATCAVPTVAPPPASRPAELRRQDRSEDAGADPGGRGRPWVPGVRPPGQDHDDEDEEHHDGPRINNDLHRCREGCAEDEEDDGGGEERDDEVEEGMDRTPARNDHEGRRYRYGCRYIERIAAHFKRPRSRQKVLDIGRRLVLPALSRRLAADCDARHPVKIVIVVLSRPVDQQVFLLVD